MGVVNAAPPQSAAPPQPAAAPPQAAEPPPRPFSTSAFWYQDLGSDSESDSDSEYESDSDPPPLTPEEQELRAKYYRQVRESQGFEFEPYNNPWIALRAIPNFWVNKDLVKDLDKYSKKAIELYNSEHGENYVFKNVERVNEKCFDGTNYYITFSAENNEQAAHLTSSNSIKRFRALVYQPLCDSQHEHFEVEFCDLKPSPPSSPST